jgi:Siphovirus Gp157
MHDETLRLEAAHYRHLAEQLKSDYGALDDQTLADTLEGLSDLPQMIEEIVRSSLDDETLMTGLKARLEVMGARLARLRARYLKKRALTAWAMGSTGLSKFEVPDFSVSLSPGVQRLVVSDEKTLPENFFVPQEPRLDRQALAQALKDGQSHAGAALIFGDPFITVRVK